MTINRLFVYGSLGPGRPNEHVLKNIGGSWETGYVRGILYSEGWGADMGFPGIRLDEAAGRIEGYVFTTEKLVEHWDALDAFEGEGYVRKLTMVQLWDTRMVEAYVYCLKDSDPHTTSTQDNHQLNLNEKKFASLQNSENGEVSDETVFHYRQKGAIVWATYEGGEILFGTLSGRREGDQLFFTYQHQNRKGEFMTGKCQTIIEEVKGRIRLHESWEWTCKDFSKGTSILEELDPIPAPHFDD